MSTSSLDNEKTKRTVGSTWNLTKETTGASGMVEGYDAPKPSRMTMRAQVLGLAICVGGFLFGYDIGVISSCYIMKPFVLAFGGTCDAETGACALSAGRQSIINSSLSIGTFTGALLQAPFSDHIGRKRSMILWSLVFTLGAVIQTATINSYPQFSVGRAIAGLGVGALSGLCPLYLGETAPKHVRGAMVAGYQLLIIFGIFVSYGVGWATQNFHESSASWKIPVGLQLLWGVSLFSIMTLLPESPRYELQKERTERAREVMAAMRGIELREVNGELRGDKWMEAELREMKEAIDIENVEFKGRSYISSYLLCFSKKQQMWKRTLNGIMLQTIQQLNGQNFYYYYGSTFFSKAAVSLNAYQIQFILGAVSLVMTIPALIGVEKLGRRQSLLIGALLQAACAFIVAFVGRYALAPDGTPADRLTSSQKSAGNAFIAFAVLHVSFFSMFWGPTPWIYLSENYPQFIRGKCISLGSASNWIWNFLLSYFSPLVAEDYDSFIMLIFGSVLVFGFFYTYLMVPEVKGLSLEEVDELYEQRVPPWRSASWTPPTRLVKE
ncbi:putative monosaccharide transporter [Violaceomyces palustris]|uniref:Monosaccharide transporter n=1 Tax=Violaceomyces palustris TaxID=1673888 RepID=A0ACD0NM36_9BASI|nr:putative monosaccharide transporter [Violaceomyces palustris]